MGLDLVAMASDVEAIADKATKETHQETSLLQLEATWDRVEFCVTSNSGEMETPLVKISEENLEVGWAGRLRLEISFPVNLQAFTLARLMSAIYENLPANLDAPLLLTIRSSSDTSYVPVESFTHCCGYVDRV